MNDNDNDNGNDNGNNNGYAVATRALYKRNIAIKNLSLFCSSVVEHQTGNLTTLVRVQVEANLFYRFSGDLEACNDIISVHAFLSRITPLLTYYNHSL